MDLRLLITDAPARPQWSVGSRAATVTFGQVATGLFADLLEFFNSLLEEQSQSLRFGDELLTLSGKIVYFIHSQMGSL